MHPFIYKKKFLTQNKISQKKYSGYIPTTNDNMERKKMTKFVKHKWLYEKVSTKDASYK